jgi:hypothetical protein
VRYRVTFQTTLNLVVDIDAEDEDEAADRAWELADRYTQTVLGDHDQVGAEASLDGIGSDEVTEMPPEPERLRKGRV